MPKLVLSFDGGGLLGYLSALLLDRLVSETTLSLADVSLFAGTSTGGLIALALADGWSPGRVAGLYAVNAQRIFTRSWLAGYGAKYKADGLRAVLIEAFGARMMGNLRTDVLVTSVCWGSADQPTYDAPVIFTRQNKPLLSMVNAALCTSAAPTYFPPHFFNGRAYGDGGLWANNPALDAAIAAGHDDVCVLSIGTGAIGYRCNPTWWMGMLGWARPLVKWWVDGTQQATDDRMAALLGDRYCRLNPEMPAEYEMDDVTMLPALAHIAHTTDLTPVIRWLERQKYLTPPAGRADDTPTSAGAGFPKKEMQ